MKASAPKAEPEMSPATESPKELTNNPQFARIPTNPIEVNFESAFSVKQTPFPSDLLYVQV